MKNPSEYSPDERREALAATTEALKSIHSQWEAAYGPFTTVSADATEEEREQELGAVDDHLIWSDVLWQDAVDFEPVPGLVLSINGWAMVPGKGHFTAEVESFLIGQHPWSGNPYDHEPVFSYLHCGCPFCDAEGQFEDGSECETCEGSGEWEIDV